MFDQDHINDLTLNEYLDEMLEKSHQDLVETHLAACAHCRSRLAEFQVVYMVLAELPDASLQRDLVPGVLDSIAVVRADEKKLESRQVLALRVLFAFQLMAVVVLLVFLWPDLTHSLNPLSWLIPSQEILLGTILHFLSDLSKVCQQMVQNFLSQGVEIWRQINQLRLSVHGSVSGLIAMLISAVALFLIGNCVLFHSNNRVQRK